jgi:hypothetical protein
VQPRGEAQVLHHRPARQAEGAAHVADRRLGARVARHVVAEHPRPAGLTSSGPASTRSGVVLPAPSGPTSQTNCALARSRSMPARATRAP